MSKWWSQELLNTACVACFDTNHPQGFGGACRALAMQRDIGEQTHRPGGLGLSGGVPKAAGHGAIGRGLAGLVQCERSKVDLFLDRQVKPNSVPITQGEVWALEQAITGNMNSVPKERVCDAAWMSRVLARTVEWVRKQAAIREQTLAPELIVRRISQT